MKLLKQLLEDERTFTGKPLEKGGTSIKGKGPAPAIRKMINNGIFEGKTVLDYGAGRYSRNAEAIREAGADVYAYDPFHGKDPDGWTGVSQTLPETSFDIAFTSYVLNVVPENIEDNILQKVEQQANQIYHITRNQDIFTSIKNALRREDKVVTNFFKEEFATAEEIKALEQGNLSDQTIREFVAHGVQTSRGFQRIPQLEDKGYTLKQNTSGYKVYTKGV